MRSDNFLQSSITGILETTQDWLAEFGGILMFLGSFIYWTSKPPYRIREIFRQMDFVGVQSGML
ncbi:MAG: hypothetical protein ACYDHG_16110, partial [Desulfomonilaceae bacterium]